MEAYMAGLLFGGLFALAAYFIAGIAMTTVDSDKNPQYYTGGFSGFVSPRVSNAALMAALAVFVLSAFWSSNRVEANNRSTLVQTQSDRAFVLKTCDALVPVQTQASAYGIRRFVVCKGREFSVPDNL